MIGEKGNRAKRGKFGSSLQEKNCLSFLYKINCMGIFLQVIEIVGLIILSPIILIIMLNLLDKYLDK